MTFPCSRCKELSVAVDEVLEQLTRLTQEQLAAFRRRDNSGFTRLDKELELTVGRKERAIGSLREHRRSHDGEEESVKIS